MDAMIISRVLITVVFADRVEYVEDISIAGVRGGELSGRRKTKGCVVGLEIILQGFLQAKPLACVA